MRFSFKPAEGDLLSPLEQKNVWLTDAWIDERHKTLEKPKLVLTAFIKGAASSLNTKTTGLACCVEV